MRHTRGLLIELLEVVALAVALFIVIQVALEPVSVDGSSMYPTTVNQDYLIALKFPYYFHAPERGDIIIMKSPYNPNQNFIKRIVGLPNENLLIKNSHVYINGKVLCEPYLRPGVDGLWTVNANWPANGQPYHLGPQQYFMMGDNRNASSDSRIFGPIPRSSIEAEAWLRLVPLNRFGSVDPQRSSLTNATQPSQAHC
ncbi:MAG: signal peptidase I [Candidatus Dormiibacterota bacterium]